MKVALFPFDGTFCRDEIFNPASVYNRDNCLYPYYRLQQQLKSMGVELHTFDTGVIQEYDKFIMFNYNAMIHETIGAFFKKQDKLLFLFEPPAILPDMWSKKNLQGYAADFYRTYTYAEVLIEHVHYFKFNFPQSIQEEDITIKDDKRARPFLLAFIGSDHLSEYPGEMYTLRRQYVHYFETCIPDFHVYGNGWSGKCYQGRCENKHQALRNHTFSLCIENTSLQGYISEKIFDSFLSSTIPVYYGAPDIFSHIPRNTFVHLRDFASVDLLVDKLIHMEQREIENYRQNIRNFLSGSGFHPFSTDCFVQTVVSGLGL
jgi:alpha(1,3/1,4) fucosyltransferase